MSLEYSGSVPFRTLTMGFQRGSRSWPCPQTKNLCWLARMRIKCSRKQTTTSSKWPLRQWCRLLSTQICPFWSNPQALACQSLSRRRKYIDSLTDRIFIFVFRLDIGLPTRCPSGSKNSEPRGCKTERLTRSSGVKLTSTLGSGAIPVKSVFWSMHTMASKKQTRNVCKWIRGIRPLAIVLITWQVQSSMADSDWVACRHLNKEVTLRSRSDEPSQSPTAVRTRPKSQNLRPSAQASRRRWTTLTRRITSGRPIAVSTTSWSSKTSRRSSGTSRRRRPSRNGAMRTSPAGSTSIHRSMASER